MNSESKDKRLRFRVKPGEPVPMFAPEICLTLHLKSKAREARGAQDDNPLFPESADFSYLPPRKCGIQIGQTAQEVDYRNQGQRSAASMSEKSKPGSTK
jgi:hypothetical protein